MKSKILPIVILLLIQLCSINQTIAQSSLIIIPDSTFGTNGNMVFNGGPAGNFQSGTGFAIEPNGKFLVVGAIGNAGAQPYIAQYLSNGIPDSTFGTNAFSMLNSYYDRTSTATGVTLLSNGKILVTGQHDLGSLTSYIVRLTANGIVDSSFATNGYLNFSNVVYPAMLLLSNGSIVFKYTSNNYSTNYLVEADNTGKLNTSFGVGGTVTIPLIGGNCNITLCQNDEILVAGNISGGIGLVRYLSNGTIDNTFGQSGIVSYTPTSTNTNFHVSSPLPVLQPDNSLVVAMSGGYYLPCYAIHVLSNGSIDATYNNSGLAVSGGGFTSSSIASGIFTLNNETLLANNLSFSSTTTYYIGSITAVTMGGILDTLPQLNYQNPSFSNFQTTSILASGTNTVFMMGDGSIGYPNVEMFKYKISSSPLVINSFTGQKAADSTSSLQWSVASIQNVNNFEILRSVDKSTWVTIGSVAANAGTSYSYTDSFPNDSTNYYRIKMVGKSSANTYSPNIVLLTYYLAPANCNPPVPYIYQLTDTSATFKFNSGGNSNTSFYQYAYMPSDGYTYTSPPGGLPLFTASDTIAHVGGLSAATTYYVFMRSMCSSHSPTAWTVTTFKTLCDTSAIPYTELFTTSSFPCIANGVWASNYGGTGIGLSNNGVQTSGWFFTKRFYLTAGKTYRIYFQYNTTNYITPTQNSSLIAQMATYPDSTSLIGSPLINLTLNTVQNNYQALDSFALFTPTISGLYCTGFYSISSPEIGVVDIPEVEVLVNPTITPCTSNISPANKTTETNFCNNFPLTWNSVPGAFSYALNISSVKFGSYSFIPYGVDTSVSENFCGDAGDTITWYVVPRILGQNATGCSSSATVFYTPIEPAPANDLCTNAQILTVTKGFCTNPVVGDLMGATFSNASDTAGICKPPLPPNYPAKNISDTSDVWYKFTVPSTGNTVVQVSKFSEVTSSTTILRAFNGSCGSLTPIACAFDNYQYSNAIEPYRVRLYLTNQTPGSTIYIRVASYLLGGNYFTIGALDTTGNISPTIVSTTNTCTDAVPNIMDSLSGKLYMWNPLFSASGQLLGEVNPGGLNFGTVNASLYVNSGSVRTSNGSPYLDRNIQITPTNTQNPYYYPAGIRMYVTPQEINAFNTASGDTVLGDFNVIDNTDNCGPTLINTGSNLGNITDYGLYQGNNYYLSFLTSSFSSYYFFKSNGSLPLNLLNFTAQLCNTSNICLNWSTVSEVNVDNIVVEKSDDGNSFKPIAVIKALDRIGTNYYSSVDKKPLNGNNFYRLKTVDKDGRVTYSKIIEVKFDLPTDIKVLPNPANNFITIYSQQAIQIVEIANQQGQVLQKSMAGGVLSKTIDTSSFASGLYYVRIETSTGITVKKIIILK
ncbi:MAG: T9SS type A sorting domain-containing protein [Ferruginibacter sp.]